MYDLIAAPKVSLEIKPDKPDKPTEPDDPTEPDKPILPQTGQLHWPVPILAVSGVVLFAMGWYLCFGKREEHEN